MKVTVRRRRRVAAFLALVLASCAPTTRITALWKDGAYRGPVSKVVVIGVFRDPETRKILENEFVARLSDRGIPALAGHKIFPGEELPDKDAAVAGIGKTGADAVLVTRATDTQAASTSVPGAYHVVPFHTDYGTFYAAGYASGYTAIEGHAFAETNLYDLKEGKKVWSGRSDTRISTTREKASGARYELIQEFVRLVIGELSRERLIP